MRKLPLSTFQQLGVLSPVTSIQSEPDQTTEIPIKQDFQPKMLQLPPSLLLEYVILGDMGYTSTLNGSNVQAIQNWLINNGPVSASMDSCTNPMDQTFQVYLAQLSRLVGSNEPLPTLQGNYEGGGSCNGEPNHAVTIVGWTNSGVVNPPAWIIQNSWGDGISSGDYGYFYVNFDNIGTGENQVNIQGMVGVLPKTQGQSRRTVATDPIRSQFRVGAPTYLNISYSGICSCCFKRHCST